MKTCTHTHTLCHAAPRKGARSVCRASRTSQVRECRREAPSAPVCGAASVVRCAAHGAHWRRVVASGSDIPTGAARSTWIVEPAREDLRGLHAERPSRAARDASAPHASVDYALRGIYRSAALRQGGGHDAAEAATAVSARRADVPRHVRHTGGTAPGTPRAERETCSHCGGTCAAVLRPGAACPRKGGARR